MSSEPRLAHEMLAPAETDARPFTVTNRMVIGIAVPMTLAFLTTPLLGLTDMTVVGQLGDAALLGGLAVGAIIFDFVFAIFHFLRAATTGLVAQAYGRGDRVEEQAIFWRALGIGVVSGTAIMLLSPLVIASGIWLMGAGPEIEAATRTYLAIRILSAPAALASYTMLGFLLGRGQSVAGLGLQIVINVTNVVLSVWLGLVLGWGLVGVAVGTVIGELAGAVVGFVYIVRRFDPDHRPGWARIVERASLLRLLSLNRDIMIRSIALLTAFALFTRAGVQFGAVTLAANAILMNFFLLSSYFLDGLATAAEQIAGRAVGANYRPAFNRAVRLTVFWGFVMAGLCAAGFLLFGGALIDFMTTAPEIRAEARAYLFLAAISAVTGVLAFQMDGVFIGATWSKEMRDMALISLALFLALLWFVVPSTGNTGLWITFNIFLAARGVTLFAILRRRADSAFGTA